MTRLAFGPEAFVQVAEAFSWYEHRRAGLGWEFSDELDGVLTLLKAQPEIGPQVHRRLRRVLLPRFPYAVFYEFAEALIRVRAVLHTRSHPRRWRRA